MEAVEKECGALGGLFQAIVNDMKCSYPVWEDFSAKATKLHSQLRTTVLAAVAFLDAFQKVADMATNTRAVPGDRAWRRMERHSTGACENKGSVYRRRSCRQVGG
ncbi:hypothetical protein DPEC_G00344500 [Dallia pectoralis]|uniref:Uncharacterized protein n=1 Tax=Dallia pectoralis TaxID=75939 RepID=A0ACC2F376_DALPE|nr:hypothetical protein DPEC_G00344500 [Dallia pectoralis]